MVKKISFRITDIVIRCPHCGKRFRIAIGLVEKEYKEKIVPKIEG